MKLLIAALALLCVYLPASAATITWTNPTGGVQDGKNVAIAPADIARSTIEYANGSTFGSVAGTVQVAGAATSGTAPDPSPGASRCYRVTTTLVAAKGGLTSGPSNVVCRSVEAGPVQPNPPSLLDVLVAWLRRIFGHYA